MCNKSRLIKDGSHFPQFPNMKTAKIFRPNPDHKQEAQSTLEDVISNHSTGRIQMEIAQAETQVALQDYLEFSETIDTVDDVDWSVHIETHHLNAGAATVNLRGILKGDIIYSNEHGTYSKKYNVPWENTCHVTYLNAPKMSSQKNKTKHLFKDDLGESSIHREVAWQYQQPITCHLNTTKITSTEQLMRESNPIRLEFQVVLYMSMSFTQLQQVSI